MDTEFHYYVTYILAKKSGFSKSDSFKIAYASQYTDDNKRRYRIRPGKNGTEYHNYVSQTMNILKPKKELFRIYPVFHFIPGQPNFRGARRKDGKRHLLNTTPNSFNARKMLQKAFDTNNMYRFCIAAHGYVDTWAHQNFVGYYDDVNAKKGGLLDKITPNIGHADAGHDPDIPGLIWDEKRLVTSLSAVNNNRRFVQAAMFLFINFKLYHARISNAAKTLRAAKVKNRALREWRSFYRQLLDAFGKASRGKASSSKRTRKYRAIENAKVYNKQEWFDKAIRTRVRGLRDTAIPGPTWLKDKYYWRNGLSNDWYRFQQAVKAHQRDSLKILKPVFAEMELKGL